MPLQVIGVGMPRTGTLSLKTAFEKLGFGPCHHMVEVFSHPEQWPCWDRIGDGEKVEWEDIFGPYRSATDAPSVFFWKELIARYPDAKVVLTERDPDRWYDSVSATIFSPQHRQSLGSSPVGAIIGKLSRSSWPGRGDGPIQGPPPRELMIEMFKAHNAEVRRTLPPERLLSYRVSEGWAPLCAFLGVAVPDEAFPHVNSTEEFHALDVPA